MSLQHLFWDSCMFIRYVIGDDTKPYFEDIARFVEDVKARKRRVYFSTLTYAEMQQEHFKGGSYGSIKDFFDDLGANFIPLEPNPNILMAASELRSAKSTNPGKPDGPSRVLSTPDAIMLASCVFARDVLGIEEIVFQSTDEGKSNGPDGKCIPLIGFERWYPETTRTPAISRVCALPKEKPQHPEPTFAGIVIRGAFPPRANDEQR